MDNVLWRYFWEKTTLLHLNWSGTVVYRHWIFLLSTKDVALSQLGSLQVQLLSPFPVHRCTEWIQQGMQVSELHIFSGCCLRHHLSSKSCLQCLILNDRKLRKSLLHVVWELLGNYLICTSLERSAVDSNLTTNLNLCFGHFQEVMLACSYQLWEVLPLPLVLLPEPKRLEELWAVHGQELWLLASCQILVPDKQYPEPVHS